MYLHVGNGETERERDIVGIFDLDTSTVSSQTRAFLSRAEKEGRILPSDGDLPKSFLLLSVPAPRGHFHRRNTPDAVRFLRISAASLRQRAEETEEEWDSPSP